MKLLFDQNLSFKLCRSLADSFPLSTQVGQLGLDRADDRAVWAAASDGGYVLVTEDADFSEMAAVLGPPPKVIWLRCGNSPTSVIADLMRRHTLAIQALVEDDRMACLEIR